MTEKTVDEQYGTEPWATYEYTPLMKVGEYKAKLLSVDKADGQYGPQFSWEFQITDGEYSGVKLLAWSSANKYTAKTKAYRWAAALGHPAETDFHPKHILGKECLLTVIREIKDDGTEYNKIPEHGVSSLPEKKKFLR